MSINVFLCFLNALNHRRRRYCRLHFRRTVFVSWRRINLQAHAPTNPDYFINVRSDHVSWSAKREVVQETKPQVRLQGFQLIEVAPCCKTRRTQLGPLVMVPSQKR